MAASALVYGEAGEVRGVVAGEFGLDKDRRPGPNYEPGMELRGKYVLLGEGVRGSLAKQVIARYGLADGREPQKYGLGMKEILGGAPGGAPARPGHPHHGLAARQRTPAAARSSTTSRTTRSSSASSST